jgi:hypothetical protein
VGYLSWVETLVKVVLSLPPIVPWFWLPLLLPPPRRFRRRISASAHVPFGNEPRVLHPESRENLPLVADKHHTFGRKFFMIFV